MRVPLPLAASGHLYLHPKTSHLSLCVHLQYNTTKDRVLQWLLLLMQYIIWVIVFHFPCTTAKGWGVGERGQRAVCTSGCYAGLCLLPKLKCLIVRGHLLSTGKHCPTMCHVPKSSERHAAPASVDVY